MQLIYKAQVSTNEVESVCTQKNSQSEEYITQRSIFFLFNSQDESMKS